MSPVITLADAIRGLVGEKRALGYKYVSEERALARFELFCAGAFPGLETVTRASVEAWIATARRRAVKPATLQSLAAPVRELARWLHRRGVDAYVLPAGVLEKPARYVPHIYSDRELAALFAATDRCHYCPEVPFRHLVMPVLFRTLFPTGRGRPLSHDAIALLVAKHASTATRDCPSLANKKVSPHTLRHAAAMNLLHAGVDSTVIALWLGHESVEGTQIYLHADMQIKERALARTTPPDSPPGRYRPPDHLLAFLEAL